MENFKMISKIFRSQALTNVIQWSRCIHKRILGICFLKILSVINSLFITLLTKIIIDAATSSRSNEIWIYGGVLIVLSLLMIVINYSVSLIHTHASAKLQHTLRNKIVRTILSKDYSKLKGFHSGS